MEGEVEFRGNGERGSETRRGRETHIILVKLNESHSNSVFTTTIVDF